MKISASQQNTTGLLVGIYRGGFCKIVVKEHTMYNKKYMAYFTFIDDDALLQAVSQVLRAADRATGKVESDLEKNVLDPFAALFSVTYNEITLRDWAVLEKERQVQKSIQNAIGEFHQNILGSFHGWQNPGRGGSFDLINDEKMIVAEIKNKHNTMNSSSAEQTYNKLAGHLKYGKKNYIAYLVQVVPQHAKDYDVPWSPNQTTLALREDIRRIDGESFYDLASGEKNTLQRIYESLPELISHISGKNQIDDTTARELSGLFERIYK